MRSLILLSCLVVQTVSAGEVLRTKGVQIPAALRGQSTKFVREAMSTPDVIVTDVEMVAFYGLLPIAKAQEILDRDNPGLQAVVTNIGGVDYALSGFGYSNNKKVYDTDHPNRKTNFVHLFAGINAKKAGAQDDPNYYHFYNLSVSKRKGEKMLEDATDQPHARIRGLKFHMGSATQKAWGKGPINFKMAAAPLADEQNSDPFNTVAQIPTELMPITILGVNKDYEMNFIYPRNAFLFQRLFNAERGDSFALNPAFQGDAKWVEMAENLIPSFFLYTDSIAGGKNPRIEYVSYE